MEEQKTNYIEITDKSSVGNIFNELSGELGDINFGDEDQEKQKLKREKNRWVLAYKISGTLFTVVFISAVILSLDVFTRTSADNALFVNLPVCGYLSLGVDDYENSECKTLPMILDAVTEEKEKIEKNIVTNLAILVPKRLQSLEIVNSPKVRFIQEHTGDARVPITGAIHRFLEIKGRTVYRGEDIDCKNIVIDEKGKMSISCDVYGWALLNPTNSTTKTSRETALDFLDSLLDPKSGFQVLTYPKTLDIAQFTSSEVGLRSIFSTKTPIDLKLQYLPANKM